MTKEEAREGLGTLWAKAIAGTAENVRKFLAVYVVMFGLFGGVGSATWALLLRPAFAAEMEVTLVEKLNAPCNRDEFGEREDSLACRLEADAERETQQSVDIEHLKGSTGEIKRDLGTLKGKVDAQTALIEELKVQQSEALGAVLDAIATSPRAHPVR